MEGEIHTLKVTKLSIGNDGQFKRTGPLLEDTNVSFVFEEGKDIGDGVTHQ